MATLHIQLLGDITARVDGASVQRARTRKDLWLLAYLALHRGETQRRQRLIDVLWPDLPEEHGRDNLTHALSRLRRLLGDAAPYLQATQTTLALAPDAVVDLLEFTRMAASPHLDDNVAAAALWCGEPLPGVDADWAEDARRDFGRWYRELVERLVDGMVDNRPEEAQRWAQLLVQIEPYDDPACRRLMRLLASHGNRNRALRHFQEFATRLKHDLDLEPESETRLLYAQLQGETPDRGATKAAIVPSRPPDELVGRDAEFRRLMTAVQAAHDGRGSTVFVGGPAGIGKSSLASAIARTVAPHGVLAVQVAARPQTRGPLMLWAEALRVLLAASAPDALAAVSDVWLEHLQVLLPETRDLRPQLPRRPASGVDRSGVFAAVHRTLAALDRVRPILLVLDDLQWAEPDTLNLFDYLSRRLTSEPLVLLGLYRSDESGGNRDLLQMRQSLLAEGHASEIPLSALGTDHLRTLLTRLSGVASPANPDSGAPPGVPDVPAELLARVVRDAHGNPLFATELFHWVAQGGTEADCPESIVALAQSRLRRLSGRARRLVQLASVLDRHVDPALLARAAPEDQMTVLACLEEGEQVGLLRRDGGEYAFSHDQLREAVYHDIPAGARRALHGRMATELARSGDGDVAEGPPTAQIEALAYHYSRSGDQQQALRYRELAGDAAQAAFASAAAEMHYRQLVEELEQPAQSADSAHAREKWGLALHRLGLYSEALVALAPLAETQRAGQDPAEFARVTAWIGRIHADRGTPRAGVVPVLAALDRLDPDRFPRERAALQAVLAILFHGSGEYHNQMMAAQRAVALAERTHDRPVLAEARAYRGLALMDLGQLKEGIRELEDTLPLAEEAGDLATTRSLLENLAWAHEAVGSLTSSAPYLQRAQVLAERLGDPVQIASVLQSLGRNAFFLGEWQQARTCLRRAETLSRNGEASWIVPYPLLELGRLHSADGDWEAASAYLARCVAAADGIGDLQAMRTAQRLYAEHDLQQGYPDRARERLEPLLDRGPGDEGDVTFLLPVLASAYLGAGDTAQATESAARAIARARLERNRRALVDGLRVSALVAGNRGLWVEAERDLRGALRMARAMRYPYAEARLLETRADVRRQHQLPTTGLPDLVAARGIWHRLGSTRNVGRVTASIDTLRLP